MPLVAVEKFSTDAARQFGCPTCDSLAGQPCLSVAAKPMDATGRIHAVPFALELPHRKRMALLKAARALDAAGLDLADLLRFSA